VQPAIHARLCSSRRFPCSCLCARRLACPHFKLMVRSVPRDVMRVKAMSLSTEPGSSGGVSSVDKQQNSPPRSH